MAKLVEKEPDRLPVSLWVRELAAVKKETPDFDHKSKYREYMIKHYAQNTSKKG